MSDFGIICETNPLHNGHKYLIDKAREAGADRIICIMSGNTVQRGEFAVTDKYTRAEALIKSGADLVLELPFPWCSGSAEYFATASVEIAKHFCDTLIFGSECGDIELLKKAALAASEQGFREIYNDRLISGEQAARAYNNMLFERIGYEFSSNDILAIEYIRASFKLSAQFNFKTVTRVGDAYLSQRCEDESYPSATALRSLWRNGEFEKTEKYIPSAVFDVYKNALLNGRVLDEKKQDMLWTSFFRLHKGEDFSDIVGADGGLSNRICAMAEKVCTYEELLTLTKTQRYTDASIRRTMLYCLAGVTYADIYELPTEALLLAASKKGRELTSATRKNDCFRIVTKPADLDKSARQNILGEKINSAYTLILKNNLNASAFIKMKPYIE